MASGDAGLSRQLHLRCPFLLRLYGGLVAQGDGRRVSARTGESGRLVRTLDELVNNTVGRLGYSIW